LISKLASNWTLTTFSWTPFRNCLLSMVKMAKGPPKRKS